RDVERLLDRREVARALGAVRGDPLLHLAGVRLRRREEGAPRPEAPREREGEGALPRADAAADEGDLVHRAAPPLPAVRCSASHSAAPRATASCTAAPTTWPT